MGPSAGSSWIRTQSLAASWTLNQINIQLQSVDCHWLDGTLVCTMRRFRGFVLLGRWDSNQYHIQYYQFLLLHLKSAGPSVNQWTHQIGERFPWFHFLSLLELSCIKKKEGYYRRRLHSSFKHIVNQIRLCRSASYYVASELNYEYPSGGEEMLISVCSETGRFEPLFTHIQRRNQIWWAADGTVVGVSAAAAAASSSPCAGAVAGSSKAAAF